MPEKIKKNLLGRTVTKTSGVNSSGVEFKRKLVKNSRGESIKLKAKTKSVLSDGTVRTLKRSENNKSVREKIKYDYPAGKSDVTRRKVGKAGLSGGVTTEKQTVRGRSGKVRSVEKSKPGEALCVRLLNFVVKSKRTNNEITIKRFKKFSQA
jgi:hypothetical protein